jgi:hypothetical protein
MHRFSFFLIPICIYLVHIDIGVAVVWADENERQIASGIAAPQCGNYDDKSEMGRTGVRRSQEDKRNKNGISF